MTSVAVPGENHRCVTSHLQTLSHKIISSIPRYERNSTLTTANYHAIMTTTASSVITKGTPVSYANKTDRYDIHVAEILSKVALNIIALTSQVFS
jgi:hypothetical protein